MADSFAKVARQNALVIHALMMHHIKSRFFGNGLGYVMTMAWPFVHLAVLVSSFYFGKRVSPYGDSILLYAAVSVVPFIAFSYTSRFIMMGAVVNRSFLQYPIVKVLDIFASRIILEVISMCIVCAVMTTLLSIGGVDCMPKDAVAASFAFGASILLFVSFGLLNGMIALAAPMWVTGFALSTIVIWITSGVFVVPSALPEYARKLIAINPVVHCIEWMRDAYYLDYNSIVLDKTYLISFCVVSAFLGLVGERVFRSFLVMSR